MPHVCPRCHRANPNDAVYCWFDGIVLQQGVAGAPAGQLSREFLFPKSSKRCRTVEEIAHCCQTEWEDARELLHRGEFGRYFEMVRRPDLVRAAQEAQTNPDPDVALLQFINNLPTAYDPHGPRLDVMPRRLALGAIKAGEQRQLTITVTNQGKGLLQGKVAVSDGEAWIKLGHSSPLSPGGRGVGGEGNCPIKAERDQDVAVHIDSRGLIGGQEYSGKLTVVTNGGIAEVPLRLKVLAVPFARPPFQGATSPRGMAERMRSSPKQAVPMLESGEVQRWFAANGWKYPVAGVPARGIGAVQQFFECLGLSKPPPLTLSETELAFHVTAPQVLRGQVSLRTATKKWVYAQVDSGVPWLRMTSPSVSGPQQAVITFDIDSGLMDGRAQQETLIRLIANGGQRLAVRVRVNVQYPRGYAAPPPVVERPLSNSRGSAIPPVPVAAVVALPETAPPGPSPLAWVPTPAAAPAFNWLPQAVEKPRRKPAGTNRLLRPLFAGAILALVFRLVLAGPAEVLARVVLSKTTNPPPGSLQCWKHSPLERLADGTTREEHFLKWFVISTWWLGGVAGAWLVAQRGGRSTDLLFGTIAGAAGGVAAAATAACVMVLADALPRAVLNALTVNAGNLPAAAAIPLWYVVAGLCWMAMGAGVAYFLCALGSAGRGVLDILGAPLAGFCRFCGLRGLAALFASD